MKTFPVVVSFYTKNTLYQLEVQNLIESCEKFNIEFSIEGVDSFGSWELNCAYKPFFILQKIKQLKKPILWIDADGIFVAEPSIIPEFDCDFATRVHADCDKNHPSKVISSTIFINHTEAAIQLLQQWAEECKKQLIDPSRSEEFWDQIALRDVLEKTEANVKALPLSYAKIFDHPCDEIPVIEHYQASRRFKKNL